MTVLSALVDTKGLLHTFRRTDLLQICSLVRLCLCANMLSHCLLLTVVSNASVEKCIGAPQHKHNYIQTHTYTHIHKYVSLFQRLKPKLSAQFFVVYAFRLFFNLFFRSLYFIFSYSIVCLLVCFSRSSFLSARLHV